MIVRDRAIHSRPQLHAVTQCEPDLATLSSTAQCPEQDTVQRKFEQLFQSSTLLCLSRSSRCAAQLRSSEPLANRPTRTSCQITSISAPLAVSESST